MIEFKNVSKTYKDGTLALHDINLEIEDGEFAYIIGPTGAGKSTLIKLLDGEEVPTSGQIIVSGKDKAEIVKKAFFGPITPTVPASILQLHDDVVVICDEDAMSLCD